jgi:hypothetical protein
MGLVPAVSTNIVKPTLESTKDAPSLLLLLTRFYERLVELGQGIMPSQAPALKAIASANIAALRQTVGATDGELGPRALLLAGGSSALDGGQAVYVWNAADTSADNGASVICPASIGPNKPGRWNRVALLAGMSEPMKVIASLHP